MKQVLVRELQEYDLRELFGEDYTDDLCNELYEKSGVIKRRLGLHNDPIQIQRGNGRRQIKFSSIAGVLSLKHMEIEIMPKFYREDDLWRENLFSMILWANSGRIEAQSSSSMRYVSRNIYDHIGLLYADELEHAIKKEAVKTYRSINESSRFLKGRILISEELQHILSSPGEVWYERDILDYENEYNFIFRWCADFLATHCRNSSIRSRLRLLTERLPVTVGFYNIPVISKLPPQYAHYTKVLEIANNVALGASMQHSKTGNTGYGYIIATEVIYEKFIERILRSLQEYHNEYLSEAQISLPFAKPMDGYMPTYHTVPDNRLMIKGEAKLLIDAKYKDNFKTGTRKKPVNSDVYQLFSSMVAHGCERGILLSPCDAAEKEDIRYWSIDNNGKQYVMGSLCVDLSDISNKKTIDSLRQRILAYVDAIIAKSVNKDE